MKTNIGPKSWAHITDELIEYRSTPTAAGFSRLEAMLDKYNWPWDMTAAQGQDWADIMERTRPAFEAA